MTSVALTLRVKVAGPVLVGGRTSAPGHVDAATARAPNGAPIIPGSALRGALREAVIRLVNARKIHGPPYEAAALDRWVDELFGRPGPDRPSLSEEDSEQDPSGARGGLRIGDAVAESWAFAVRPGVAIDRWLGATAHRRFFQRQVHDAAGDVFTADVSGRASAEAMGLLRDALTLVGEIGNSTSRGLGAIESVELAHADRPSRGIEIKGALKDGSQAIVRIVARTPLALGAIPMPGNHRRTLLYAPGSAIRGALAQAVLRAGIDPDAAAFQRAFVDTATCARFSDALPCRGSSDLPLPAPRTFLRCRDHEDRNHRRATGGVKIDTLLPGHLADRIVAERGASSPWKCSVCGKPLRAAEGFVPSVHVRRRVVTRLARDPFTRSARSGMLFSQELLELHGVGAAVEFVGTVTVTSDLLAVIRKCADTEVYLGSGQGHGLGRVEVRFQAAESTGVVALEARRRRWLKAAKTQLDAAHRLSSGHTWPVVDNLIPILARTDLCIAPSRTPDELARIVGHGARPIAVHQTTGVRSGWDEAAGGTMGRPGPRPLRPVVAAGSIWLFECDSSPTAEHLASLEASPAGGDTWLGMGHLRVFPETVLDPWEGTSR